MALLNTDMASLAMRMIDDNASAAEQTQYAQRLIAVGERLQRRANDTAGPIIEGDVVTDGPVSLPAHTVQVDWEP